ncbi:hypothetical protein FRC12_013301 [Ceratobasidium sp. 428]|nr:hypothetical protein FRC12_013301 [Ceratobasidium sp. 428]
MTPRFDFPPLKPLTSRAQAFWKASRPTQQISFRQSQHEARGNNSTRQRLKSTMLHMLQQLVQHVSYLQGSSSKNISHSKGSLSPLVHELFCVFSPLRDLRPAFL